MERLVTLEDVYRKFGEVAEAAQLLETELGNILILIGAADANLIEQADPAVAAQLFKRINRHTLGQLLVQLHRSTDSAAHIEDILSAALRERNRLSHSFYREHNFRRNSTAGCALMVQDLESMHETLIEALKATHLLSGIDLDNIALDSLPTVHVPI
jgi:hypothetical protein